MKIRYLRVFRIIGTKFFSNMLHFMIRVKIEEPYFVNVIVYIKSFCLFVFACWQMQLMRCLVVLFHGNFMNLIKKCGSVKCRRHKCFKISGDNMMNMCNCTEGITTDSSSSFRVTIHCIYNVHILH